MNNLVVFLLAINGQANDLPQGLLESICFVESRYNINAVHKDDGGTDSLGLCQIKLRTAKWLGFKGTERELMEPQANAYYAAKYLKYNLKRYHGNMIQAVIAYNAGNANGKVFTSYSRKVMRAFKTRGHNGN